MESCSEREWGEEPEQWDSHGPKRRPDPAEWEREEVWMECPRLSCILKCLGKAPGESSSQRWPSDTGIPCQGCSVIGEEQCLGSISSVQMEQ